MAAAYFQINPYLLCIFFVMLGYSIYRYLSNNYKLLDNLGIPGPKPVWIFGNALDFKDKDILGVFKSWKDMYGKVYGFYEGFRAGIVINDPDMAKEVLSKNFDHFYTRPVYRPFQYYPCDLQLINIEDGEQWKRQRGMMNRALNVAGVLKQAVQKIEQSSQLLVKTLEKQRDATPEGFNTSELIDRFTTDVIMRMILEMNEEEIQQHKEMVYDYEVLSNQSASSENEASGLARLFPMLTPLLRLSDKKHKAAHENILVILRSHLRKAINTYNNNKVNDSEHQSLLTHIINSKILTRDIDGSLTRRELTSDEILAHILALVSETFQTMTSSIKFVLYELAMNQECQAKLYEEISHTFGKADSLDVSTLNRMEYFEMVFNEAYRLHPVAPGVQRTCTSDVTIDGIQFKKDMPVRIMTSSLYSDEKHFPEPAKFDPERFSQEQRSERHQFLFLPFGQGPRICPGQKLAMLELKIAFIYILRNFHVEVCEKTEIPLQTSLRPSLCPKNGVAVRLVPRSRS